MYNHIVVATDGSELAARAVQHGIALAKEQKAQVSLVTVTEIWSAFQMAHDYDQRKTDPIGAYEDIAASAAQRVLDRAAAAAKEQGVACNTIHVRDRHPAEGIIEAARDAKADLIVMASHGRRGVGRLLLGSQANEVVARATVPVLIVR